MSWILTLWKKEKQVHSVFNFAFPANEICYKKYLLYSAASIGENVQGKCHYSQHLGALFIQQLIITLETKGDDYDSSVKPQKQV